MADYLWAHKLELGADNVSAAAGRWKRGLGSLNPAEEEGDQGEEEAQ